MGEKKRTVVLYGNSLVISSIAASLESQPHLSVHQVNAPGADLARHLEALNPDVLVFDVATAKPDDAVTLLSQHPRLSLICIDPDSRQMLLWSGRRVRALTVQDLVQAINALPGSTGRLERLRQFVSAMTRTRRRRLTLGAAAVVVCMAALLALSLAYLTPNAPLSSALHGTVVGAGFTPLPWLVFAAGIVLGGILVGLWLSKRRNTKKP
jgi:hypothetical protein